jgi:hypothetical protein
MAGFEVITYGRFWPITEVDEKPSIQALDRTPPLLPLRAKKTALLD